MALEFWNEYQMCKMMKCTYTELQDQPYLVSELFMAFAQGERQGEKQIADSR